MPVRCVDTETWLDTAGRDQSYVLGDEADVVGDEADSASVFIELLVGSPIQQIVQYQTMAATASRRTSLTVTARRVTAL